MDITTYTPVQAHTIIWLSAYGRKDLHKRGYTATHEGIFAPDGVLAWSNPMGNINRFKQAEVRASTLETIPQEVL